MYGRTQLGAAAAGMLQEQGAVLKRSCAPGSSSTSAQRLFAFNQVLMCCAAHGMCCGKGATTIQG
jgi:hypothetical protein